MRLVCGDGTYIVEATLKHGSMIASLERPAQDLIKIGWSVCMEDFDSSLSTQGTRLLDPILLRAKLSRLDAILREAGWGCGSNCWCTAADCGLRRGC